MFVKVYEENESVKFEDRNTLYLVKDKWDDWFQYSTLYIGRYVDNTGLVHHIGGVKIGMFNMGGKYSPDIPRVFSKLDEKYFSLWVSEDCYETIRKLGDYVRKKLLINLNDIAYNLELFERCRKEHVTQTSLLRDINLNTVKEQFNRIAHGGARLTEYSFEYEIGKEDKMVLEFDVIPNTNPSTNIHILIGRNGVGKTNLLKNMVKSLISDSANEYGRFNQKKRWWNTSFSNLVFLSFSAFDNLLNENENERNELPFIQIGLNKYNSIDGKEIIQKNPIELEIDFVESLKRCILNQKIERWVEIIRLLESDIMFKESNIKTLSIITDKNELEEKAKKVFSRLSSGHKIIMLIISKLVECVEEKTLVILDEPEGHLHPPLISAFIRGLSELLIKKNGVAIIATHSPVILQEVPKSCAWKLRRIGDDLKADRLSMESFGAGIGELTSEVFGLEVENSGFHKLLKDQVEKGKSYSQIMDHFNGQLGTEGKAILRVLLLENKGAE